MKSPIQWLLSVFLSMMVTPAFTASFEAELEELTRERKTLVTSFQKGDMTYEQYVEADKLLLDKLEEFNSKNEEEMRRKVAQTSQHALESALKSDSELPDLDDYVLENRLGSELSFDESTTISNSHPVTLRLATEGMQRHPILYCRNVLAYTLLPEEYNNEVRGASVMMRHIDKNRYQAFVKGKDMLYLIALHVDETGRWEANDIYVYKQRVE